MPIKKYVLTMMCMMFQTTVMAFTCEYTVSKDCCWTNFDVRVAILDVRNKKELTSLKVPAGKSVAKSSFSCQPGQQLELVATFSPTIWDNDKDKVYRSRKYIALKSTISPEDVAWHIPVVFPNQFAEVPLPLKTTGCKCADEH